MKQLFFALVAVLCCALPATAQTESFGDRHNKAVFLELGGSGLIYSLNYDMRLNRGRQDGMGFRVGIGGLGGSASSGGDNVSAGFVAIPLTFNYLLGERRHALELGAGATILTGRAEGSVEGEFFEGRGTAPLAHANIGYRFQSLGNGFTGRVTYTPFIGQGIGHWVGVSFGVNFK